MGRMVTRAEPAKATVLTRQQVTRLLEALASSSPVSGLTHRFYRYPARFSPDFVAHAIDVFTQPGDYVLDPFMGGGTSLVEALASGRRVLGCDINPLAGFLTRVKTTPLGQRDVAALVEWVAGLESRTTLNRLVGTPSEWIRYQRHLPWWLRKTLQLGLATVKELDSRRTRRFAKCSLLKTAQWALDCRAEIPTREQFLQRHRHDFAEMLGGMAEFGRRTGAVLGSPSEWLARYRRILVRNAAGLESDHRLPRTWGAPRLILTSPPYVGVHILYHRWQVRGRRETPAPYWVIGSRDGKGGSYYNFADRRNKTMMPYLGALAKAFQSISSLMDERSVIVQLVAFADPEQQLPLYLATLSTLGLHAVNLGAKAQVVSREVPNRKWYADVKGSTAASREFLLVHRLA